MPFYDFFNRLASLDTFADLSHYSLHVIDSHIRLMLFLKNKGVKCLNPLKPLGKVDIPEY